jgi:hypothetical protein
MDGDLDRFWARIVRDCRRSDEAAELTFAEAERRMEFAPAEPMSSAKVDALVRAVVEADPAMAGRRQRRRRMLLAAAAAPLLIVALAASGMFRSPWRRAERADQTMTFAAALEILHAREGDIGERKAAMRRAFLSVKAGIQRLRTVSAHDTLGPEARRGLDEVRKHLAGAGTRLEGVPPIDPKALAGDVTRAQDVRDLVRAILLGIDEIAQCPADMEPGRSIALETLRVGCRKP